MIILGSNHNLMVSLCPYIFELLKIKCFRCNKVLTTFSHTGKNNLPWCDYICLDCDLKYEVKSHFNCKYLLNKKQCNKDLFIGGNIETNPFSLQRFFNSKLALLLIFSRYRQRAICFSWAPMRLRP